MWLREEGDRQPWAGLQRALCASHVDPRRPPLIGTETARAPRACVPGAVSPAPETVGSASWVLHFIRDWTSE